MITGLICTDREGKILDVFNSRIWEEMYFLPKDSVTKDSNFMEILFQTEFFKGKRIQNNFKESLESLVTKERSRLITKRGESTIEIYHLNGHFFYITDLVASSYLADSEHARDLIVNTLITAGLEIEGIIRQCNAPKLDIGSIKAKAKAASREIKLTERLNYDIPIMQNLVSGRFEVFLHPIRLNDDIIEPTRGLFSKSYGERKISINYETSLDEEVELIADRTGMLFITRAFFGIPVINSRVHNFRKFRVSYGHRPEKKDGKDMHVIVYWAEWPFQVFDEDIQKILTTTEHATYKDEATGKIIPEVGLKYSRDIALRHGGDIEITHKPYEQPKPTTEFRLYIPVK